MVGDNRLTAPSPLLMLYFSLSLIPRRLKTSFYPMIHVSYQKDHSIPIFEIGSILYNYLTLDIPRAVRMTCLALHIIIISVYFVF